MMSTKKKKAKKSVAKKLKGKMIEIEADLPLTAHEKVKRGEQAAQFLQDRDNLIMERKKTSDEYAARIKSLDARAKTLLKEFTTATETRTIKALEVKNFEKSKVEYHFKGAVVKSRPMIAEDRQEDLPLKGGKVEARPAGATVTPPGTETQKAKPEGDKACVAVPGKKPPVGQRQPIEPNGHDMDSDIADVMRAETGRKTKTSAVDGPTVN